MAAWLHAALIGVLTGAGAWSLFGEPIRLPSSLERFKSPPGAARADPTAILLARLGPMQSFGLLPPPVDNELEAAGGPMQLRGTALSPGRRAALISIGGATPLWVAMDEPAGGVELIELEPGRAVLRTGSGQTVSLEMFQTNTPAGGEGQGE